MKKIVCEICGGELIKDSGVFVCQNCGCKYSVKEAKKMMAEVEGTVNVATNKDKENQILKKRADEAFETENWIEAAKYYTDYLNKADGDYETNYRCLLSKTQCLGSNLNGLPYIGKSIELALSKLSDYAKELVNDNLLSSDERITKINYAIKLIEGSIWWIFNLDKETSITAENTNIVGTSDGYIELMNTLEECFGYYDTFFNAVINACKLIPEIALERKKVVNWGYNLLSWYVATYTDSAYGKQLFLNSIGKDRAYRFKKSVSAFESKINELASALKKKRIEEYWKKHANKKNELENELNDIMAKIQEYENEIKIVFGKKELEEFNQKINALLKEKYALGFFKFKEKKAIQDKIDDETSKMNAVKKQMNDEINAINAKIESLKSRSFKIKKELTRAR
ncbi:MAG: hypothetical protein SOR23_01410 [Candidatus Enterosoma sp.]|nr:hypothetical protein [Candidatus Enterosoma sp.]